MKINRKSLIPNVAIPVAVGIAAGMITRGSMKDYEYTILKPALSPPGWIFPVVWTILYILMGLSAYLVFSDAGKRRRRAKSLYIVQLAVNFVWPIVFFTVQDFGFALILLTILWVLVLIMSIVFGTIRKPAGLLQIPYIAWLTFAWYLNYGVSTLNGG